VRIVLKRAYADGTVAVEMDPLSLLSRLATSAPPPRYHTVKTVLAAASPCRARIAPRPAPAEQVEEAEQARAPKPKRAGDTYRPWAQLLARTFEIDVLSCPNCKRRMKLLAVVTARQGVARYLAAVGELQDVPGRSPSRGPPTGRAPCCAAGARRRVELAGRPWRSTQDGPRRTPAPGARKASRNAPREGRTSRPRRARTHRHFPRAALADAAFDPA